MFSLFFTTPVNEQKGKGRRPPPETPARRQALLTWGLLLVWLLLMSFGVVSIINPPWLQELARPGIDAESRHYKDYGDTALAAHNYRTAIAQYVRSLEIKPRQVRVLLNLAIAHMHAGNTARAEEILQDALRMESSRFIRGAIYYNCGELRERQGRRAEAIRYYQQSLESGAEQDKVCRRLGSLYLAAKDYNKALEAFARTLASQLDLTRSYRDMLHRSLDMYEGDATRLAIIEERLSRDVRVEDLARYDLETIRQVQRSDPEIAKTHNHLGVIQAQLGDIAEATRHFQGSLEIWPGNTDATKNLQLLERYRQRQP